MVLLRNIKKSLSHSTMKICYKIACAGNHAGNGMGGGDVFSTPNKKGLEELYSIKPLCLLVPELGIEPR